jgi:hypothetical protein
MDGMEAQSRPTGKGQPPQLSHGNVVDDPDIERIGVLGPVESRRVDRNASCHSPANSCTGLTIGDTPLAALRAPHGATRPRFLVFAHCSTVVFASACDVEEFSVFELLRQCLASSIA